MGFLQFLHQLQRDRLHRLRPLSHGVEHLLPHGGQGVFDGGQGHVLRVDYAAVPQPHGLLVVEGVVVALVPELDMEISGIIQQIQGLQLFGICLVQRPHLPGGHISRLQLIQQLPASVCWGPTLD